MKKSFPLLAVLFIAGCSTSAVNQSTAKLAPSEQVFLYQIKSSEYSSSITVVRDTGLHGAACLSTVYIDGIKAAKLDTAEKVTFYIQPGNHVIGAGFEKEGLFCGDRVRQERDITIKADESRAYRVFTDQDGNIDIRSTTLN
ncbi:hypothetical protein JA116_16795 [Morganella morganii]|uniref:hypothetical protein n=1 Tax=Morganella morganii TaxID=582 RepID=UPI000D1DC4D3|nr:hypothetical protein [Morganella morganii]QXO42224.1 hypothetical protein CXB74_016910 [Morganella morganii]QXO45856.1 hypothetical protein JC862_16335 [Morganella morganii]QXO49525.1 hypothetical protein JC861_17150 [Morganella morganii]QXO53386.1 hypothetical protein JC830_17165 [Morganella morganii]QXO80025.1 hypothetical protein JA116_16795 [Morganella morganii]